MSRRRFNLFKLRGMLLQPRFLVPASLMQLLIECARASSSEVGGFGLVERLDSTTFLLVDVYMVDQLASEYHIEFDLEALNRSDSELVKRRLYRLRRMQWHSHVMAAAFFSRTDLRNIRRRSESWLISMVVNQHGHYEARLDLNIGGTKRQRPLTVNILFDRDELIATEAKRMVEKHVRVIHPIHGLVPPTRAITRKARRA